MTRNRKMARLGWLLLATLLLGTGCTVRYITEAVWMPMKDGNQTLYLTYWEGSCVEQAGQRYCSPGDSKVKRCNVTADNMMPCVNEADAEKALNP